MSVTITCKRERSRRRCGLEFTREPTTFPDGYFTDEEIERLQADPVLTVEIVDEGPNVPGKNASHAILDAFAQEHQEDHPELAEFIGKDANEGWTRPLKLAAIVAVFIEPEETRREAGQAEPGSETTLEDEKTVEDKIPLEDEAGDKSKEKQTHQEAGQAGPEKTQED